MKAADIKHIIEVANGNPIKFVSANVTLVYSKDKFSTVFLDDANERLAVLRPDNNSYTDSMFPFEVTYLMYDQIETATILLREKDVEKFIKNNASKLLYKTKTADELIDEIRKSPQIKNFDPKPSSSPYEVKRSPLRSQIIRPDVKP